MQDVIEYIEKTYLGRKKLTNGTRNMIKAMVSSYGNEVVLHTVTKKENGEYLENTMFNNQAHFESAVLYILKKNAPYMKKAYELDKAEFQYEKKKEPPALPKHKQPNKENKRWVF